MSMHQGHRQRLRERFRREGLDGFHEINALELLLFYCIPQKDTNPIAHALLDRFGTLCNVLEAKPEQLARVDGVGEGTATYLNLIAQLLRYCSLHQEKGREVATTSDAYFRVLRSHFIGVSVEKVCMLCLDAKHRIICCAELGAGNAASADLPIRAVVENALYSNAFYVVLAHNHPNGVAIPSDEDVAATRILADALEMVGITLEDHLVIADQDCVSLRNSRYFAPERN